MIFEHSVLIPYINIHTHQNDAAINKISIIDWSTSIKAQSTNLSYFSAGLHPWFIDEINAENQFKEIAEQAIQTNCMAVGECGLDKIKGPALSIQKPLFERQIELAIQLKKPVIVHCVQAFDMLSSIIKKYQHKVVFIVHGFNQNEQIAAQLLKQGVYLSFGKALLNGKNERLKYIFEQTPNNKIFVENDDSSYAIEQIYEMAAFIKKCDLNVMKEIIFANYKTVFTHE